MQNRLVLLDIEQHQIVVIDRESGEELQKIVNIMHPDGVQVDNDNGYLYWTDMGFDRQGESFVSPDGTIWRCDFNGNNFTQIVGNGDIYTPKQLKLDEENQTLYWCDREGARVMRCHVDGTELTTLVERGKDIEYPRSASEQCVGIALDKKDNFIYWSQKGPAKGGQGRLFRAGLTLPADEKPWNRSDITLLADNLPEPIDLEIDYDNQYLYWTDRGAEPYGNSLNRAKITEEPEILVRGFHEAIGLALDSAKQIAYVSDLSGRIYQINLTTMDKVELYKGKMITGIDIY